MFTKTEKIRRIFERDPYADPTSVKNRLKTSKNLVYRVRKEVAESSNGHVQRSPSRKKDVSVTLDVNLSAVGGSIAVQVRARNGNLVGTVILEEDGLSFRGPKKRVKNGRKIGFEILKKISEIGFA